MGERGERAMSGRGAAVIRKLKASGPRLVHRILLILTLVALLFPIYWLIVTSMTIPSRIISRDPGTILPFHLTLENYRFVLSNSAFAVHARNSFLVACVVSVLGVSISGLGAY